MTTLFFYSITLLSLFIAIVLALFFYFTKNGDNKVNKLLAGIIILFALQIIYSFSVSNYGWTYFIRWHKELFLLRQTAFLIGPFIYLFMQTFLKIRQIKRPDLIHAIPFIAILVFLSVSLIKKDYFIIWESKLDLYNTMSILAFNLVYIILPIIKLWKLKHSIVRITKYIKASSHIGLFQFILLGFVILWIINLNTYAIYMIMNKLVRCAITGSIYSLIAFLFINSIMFLILLKPEIYILINKYKNNHIDENDKNNYKLSLINYMTNKKPFLESEITLSKVASDLSINSRILSQIINESFNNNFNGYMNEFRIKEAILQLSDFNNRKTILEILFDSGFSSKSVFYTEFKKHTGLTPKEYQARCRKQEMVS